MSAVHSILMAFRPSSPYRTCCPGNRFAQWTVLGVPFRCRFAMESRPHVVCKCDCGGIAVVNCKNLIRGQSTSCGHEKLRKMKKASTHHGFCKRKAMHPLYRIHANMLQRCHNPADPTYHYYGGRGITVTDEWRTSVASFIKWALSHGWRAGLQVDRIDNDGPYSPQNCRFVRPQENMRNSRTVRIVQAFGEAKTLVEWFEDSRCATTYKALSQRIHRLGWCAEQAIITPTLNNKTRTNVRINRKVK